jgi:hypothetical protein
MRQRKDKVIKEIHRSEFPSPPGKGVLRKYESMYATSISDFKSLVAPKLFKTRKCKTR